MMFHIQSHPHTLIFACPQVKSRDIEAFKVEDEYIIIDIDMNVSYFRT